MTYTEQAKDYRKKIESVAEYIPDTKACEFPELFPPWSGNSVKYSKDDRVHFGDWLYKVLQDHTSQASWPPDKVPALFSRVQIEVPNMVLNWVTGEAVKQGDKRQYEMSTYECIQGHTTQKGWEPPKVVSLWKKI